jgi:hypothetical protein
MGATLYIFCVSGTLSNKSSSCGKSPRLLAQSGFDILTRMTRQLHNWSYRDLTDFLKENGFILSKQLDGSHERWMKHGGNGETDKILEINFTHTTYPVGTLKGFVRRSGIPHEEWIRWSGA